MDAGTPAEVVEIVKKTGVHGEDAGIVQNP